MWGRRWYVDDVMAELRIVIPDFPSLHAREGTEREMARLLWRARHEPSVRRILLEVYSELRRYPAYAHDDAQLSPAVVDELSFAAFSRQLRIERMPPRTQWIPVAPETEPEIPEPLPTPIEVTWFEVTVLDEVGEPLSGIELLFRVDGRTERRTTDGSGTARMEGVERGTCSVKMANEGSVRDKLRARWSSPRGKDWYKPEESEETKHTFVEVRRTRDFPSVTLFAEEPHRIVLQPRVVQANLKGMWFATSKCFLMPTARHSLECIKTLYDANPGTDLLIVGHTDRAGTPSYNDPLSLERAESMAAYLTNDVDAWMKWYGADKPHEKRWGKAEDELMIRALADESGDEIPAGKTPVSWYQSTRGLPGDDKPNDAMRRALVLEYMDLDGTTLPDGIVPVPHGCGENFPVKPTADGKEEIENRRVELFFFENATRPPDRPSAVLPPPSGKNSAAGSKQYPEWMKRVQELHDFEAGAWIRLLMKYDDESLASNVRFRIRYDDGTETEAATSEAGVLMVHAMKDQGWSIMGIEDESVITSFT